MEKFLKIKDVMEFLPFSEYSLWRMCRDKEIPHHHVGRTYLFKASELIEWMDSKFRKPKAKPGRKVTEADEVGVL